MKNIKISLLSLALLFAVASCKQNKDESSATPESTETVVTTEDASKPAVNSEFQEQTVDDGLAAKITDYLNNSFLKAEDLKVISAEERSFQLYTIDLNKDGKKEVFVYLNSPYFCGSGGCTVLLLSEDLNLITKFTVTRPPLFVEPSEKNGWNVLSVQSGNEWKELVYNNGTYPSNPSIAAKASYAAPDTKAIEIFGNKNLAKTYPF